MSLASAAKFTTRASTALSWLALLLGFAACGGAGGSSDNGGPPPPPPPPPPVVQPARFLYVYATGGFSKNGPIPQGITGFTVNAATGVLTPMTSSPFAVPFAQDAFEVPLAATPDSKFLYANGPTTVQYSIGADGALTQVGNFAIPGGHIQMTPSGKFLYAFGGTELGKGEVLGFQITASGALVPLAQAPQAFSGDAFDASITPSGKFLYALVQAALSPCVDRCLQIQVVAFSIDSNNGALTPVAGSPFVATDSFALKECDCPDLQRMDLAMDGQGRFMYLPNTINNNIVGFAINGTTGALTPLPGSPFGIAFGTAGAVDPAGKFLFLGGTQQTASGSRFGMIALSIDASGALTAVPGSPFASVALDAERVANELAVDPSGKFLYVRNIGSPGSMAVFSIAAGGTLKDVPGSPFQTPEMVGNGPGPFVAVR